MIGDLIRNNLLLLHTEYLNYICHADFTRNLFVTSRPCDKTQAHAIKTVTDGRVKIHAQPPVTFQQHFEIDDGQAESHVSVRYHDIMMRR
jgi:hypothetical protein